MAQDDPVLSGWWSILGVVLGIAAIWAALIVVLLASKPDGVTLQDALRLLPDLLRLLKRLASDRTLPRGCRARLVMLLGYLALPIDLIPDFVPVLGYADDAIVIALVLRSVVRRAGPGALTRHWPGTPDGLEAVRRLCRLPDADT